MDEPIYKVVLTGKDKGKIVLVVDVDDTGIKEITDDGVEYQASSLRALTDAEKEKCLRVETIF